MPVYVCVYISPIYMFSVPERNSVRKALYKLLLHLFCEILSCSPLAHSAFPGAVPRVCCQTCDVIAGAVESWRGRQGRSFTSSVFLHAREDLFFCFA